MLGSENQKNELVAYLEALKAEVQVAHDSRARLGSATVALMPEKGEVVMRLLTQLMNLERLLHDAEEQGNFLVRSKDLESNLENIDDDKIEPMDHVVSILEESQKREYELVGILESCQEQIRTTECGQHNLLSSIEMSNAVVHHLEGQNDAMFSEFDQERYTTEGKIADLASELQISQDRQLELQLQLQGLREENTYVVMKASNLDQEVEELKSDNLRLSGDLERLVQVTEKREKELEFELRTCKELVQSLEAEKLASMTLIDDLCTQVRELEEDKGQLTGLSNEASQSVQHLWEENTRLIEGYNRLEQEKRAHDEERMELVAGIQTVWEQLHVANEREALLTSDLRGLNERRDAEEVLFDQKLKDLVLKLEALEQEKVDLISKAEEKSQVLQTLLQDSSQKLKDLQEEKDQLVCEVSELVKQREETEQAVSVQQISWELQVQGLESEKAVVRSTVENLEQLFQSSIEEVKDLKDKNEKSNQLVLELRKEITRLTGEVDKLEEVKERQEGERLELAADLQAAWNQILAVRDSEATIATELSELKDLRNEEKLRSDELVQDLCRQLQELEERTCEAGIKVEQVSKRLHELRKEQDLQDENQRLAAEIAMLEQEKGTILTEKAVLLEEVQSLQGRVENLELDKTKMAFEIEELNQWLQGPAAEKKQLAENLDEITRLLKGLELERAMLTNSVSEMKAQNERMQKDAGKLQDVINVLKEEKSKSLLVHEDSIRQLESLEEMKQQALRMQEDHTLLVQNLSEKIHVLEEESARFTTVHEVTLLRIQSLEEEKTFMERLLEEQSAGLNLLRLENIEHFDALGKFEGELELRQMEVQLLKTQVSSLEELNLSMKTLHDTVFSRLQTLEAEKFQAVNSIISLGEEKRLLLQSLKVSELRMQGLNIRNLDLSEAVSRLEVELMKRSEETQTISGCLSGVEQENENLMSQHKELLENLQVENLQHINHAVVMEDRMQRTQAELRRHEEHMESLLTVHQDTLLQLQGLAEEKVELTKVLDDLKLSVQNLRAENLYHISKAKFSEGELERRLAEIQGYQVTLFQLQILGDENVELVKSLDASNLSFRKFQSQNVEHTYGRKILKEELALSQAVVQRLEEKVGSLSYGHQKSLLQLEVLKEGKEGLVNSLTAFNLSFQELQVRNDQQKSTIKTLVNEVARRQAEIRSVEEPKRLSSAYQDSLIHFEVLKEKADLVIFLGAFNLSIQDLHGQNGQCMNVFEDKIMRRQAEVQRLEDTDSLSTVHQTTLLHLQASAEETDPLAKVFNVSNLSCLKLQAENSEHVTSINILEEEMKRSQGDMQDTGKEIECLSTAHQDSSLVEPDFTGEVSMNMKCSKLVEQLEMENVDFSTAVSKLEKLLHDESQIFRDKVQSLEVGRETVGLECPAKLHCSAVEESKLAKALEDSSLIVANFQAVTDYLKATILDLGRGNGELANQLKLMQEQTRVIVAERDQLSSELQVVRQQLQECAKRLQKSENVAQKFKETALELSKQLQNYRGQVPKQVGCTPMSNGDLVARPVPDRVTMSFGQMEISHLTVNSREELQQACLGWIETITTVCQELAKLLRSVGEEKEKLPRKQGMSHQKTGVLTNLCQELDRLILGVREKTERFAEELSLVKQKLVKLNNERFSLGSCADLNVGNYTKPPKLAALEEGEFMLDVETSCQTLQLTQVEKTELEAHVANLSSCLADSQGQLKALIVKSSTGNPYLLTSRADDGGHRKGLACFSADDNSVLNYGCELKVGRNIKALDHEKKEKKGNAIVSSFTQDYENGAGEVPLY